MRNPKFLKTGPEFYKTQTYLENYLLILTNIQTWVNYRLYSQDLANLVQENIGFNFKTVYQMFRFRTKFLPESRKCWRGCLIILCLILYELVGQRNMPHLHSLGLYSSFTNSEFLEFQET